MIQYAMEDIFILAEKITFALKNTFNEHKQLVGFLKFETATIDRKGFEIVFASKQDRIVCTLAFNKEDKCWNINVHIMQHGDKRVALSQALDPDILGIGEALVYKVHKSTLQFVSAKGGSLAILVAKDLIRYYKVLYMHSAESYYISKPYYVVNGVDVELPLGKGKYPFPSNSSEPNKEHHVTWQYKGKKVTIADARYIVGYPCPQCKYFIAIYNDNHGPYQIPNNVVVYNADGSIHVIPTMPYSIISSWFHDRDEKITHGQDYSFSHVSSEIDSNGNIQTVLHISYGYGQAKKIWFFPETGCFKTYSNSEFSEESDFMPAPVMLEEQKLLLDY